MKILALNGGSSSLKYALYDGGDAAMTRLRAGTMESAGDVADALARVFTETGIDIDAFGHRLVFGGDRYDAPVRADAKTLHDIEELVAIEPLHLRAELDLVYAAMRACPHVPNILCFDTAFHRRSPAIAHRLPLPDTIDPTLQRYGFHGLSYEYVVSQLPADAGRTVIAHLGSGASLCALRDGEPVDTTMGFTALGGLMMGTRPGDLDPGVVLRLLGSDGYDFASLTELLYYRCGLFGVSGSSADMRTLLAREQTDVAARGAIELFIYQLRKQLGAMIAVIGGLDTLVFTGGIGENAASIRDRLIATLTYLGKIDVLVIPTDENLMIARHTETVLRDQRQF
jgi:acetate kinase